MSITKLVNNESSNLMLYFVILHCNDSFEYGREGVWLVGYLFQNMLWEIGSASAICVS